MKKDLTQGAITKGIVLFAIPMILGNLLQQLYNVADTFVVGNFLGADALAAVGSAYTLMVFVTSILLGLCMGSGAIFSIQYGARRMDDLKNSIFVSFIMIAGIAILLHIIVFVFLDLIMRWLQVPTEIYDMMKDYLQIIFLGIGFTFLYNYVSSILRSIGNSVLPLIFLAVSAILNVVLDVLFVAVWHLGVEGAAYATVIAQAVSAIGIVIYTLKTSDILKIEKKHMQIEAQIVKEIFQFSTLTCIQQSVMNFGILMIQGLVNSFGTTVMAAFAVAVKIDSFAYMPVQDFGNAFSIYTAQNFGANKQERIQKGLKVAFSFSTGFCILVSLLVCIFAQPLMEIFIDRSELEILAVGVEYLRIEGTFYVGIGCLFLWYGYYRAIKKPSMSVILTIVSLGLRVVLAYILASIPAIGVQGIWWAIPIGWFFADILGLLYYIRLCRQKHLRV